MGELKALSKLKMAGKLHYWRGTIEIPETELHTICDEIQAEYDRAVAVMGYEAAQAERTCTVEKTETDEFGHWVYVSCGHVILTHGKPSYCSTCGAKVVEHG